MRAEEIRGLMEAYSKVHEIQEVLNEEVVGEDLETLDESRLSGPQRVAARRAAAERRNVAAAQAPAKPTARPGRGQSSRYQAYSRDKGRGGDAAYRAGGGDAAAKGGLTRQQIQQKGMSATRAASKPAAPAAKPAAPAAKPAAPAAKPAAPAAAKPAAATKPTTPTKPAPGTKAAGAESIKPKTPNPLMQRTFGYQKGQAPDQVAKVKASTDQAAKNLSGKGALKSSLDLFDVVKGYLLDEGYAETEENAIVIMANMSEEWRNDIIEGYQRNPEKGEKEDKKYEKVRGEKTPMPPRGDKRREDFEKWYAKQMGR